ncbi:MAG: beta-lactamase family protein [Saprospiraceae bacterium]|nr:beta-lactamase family protein [Saprospiraceae bacterium]
MTSIQRHIKPLIFLLLLLSSCIEKEEIIDEPAAQFTSELLMLKEYFQIPDMAVSIEKGGNRIYHKFFGVAGVEQSIDLDSLALFPIASLTKVFSGVLIMKLVEQEKLSLNAPINSFLATPILGDSILVKHVLSHTSQGRIGKSFYYSSRFGLLTQVIEQVYGKPFSEVMENEIIRPLKLKSTFLLKDSTQITRITKPYTLNDGIENGFIDYGYSASAGIVSNITDLAIFNEALDNNRIISKESRELMFSSFKHDLPYGYGVFNQHFGTSNIVWAYGQYDCYSSLLLKIPSEHITLIILANTSLLSDPARLINGDVTSSLFAISFLKNYIYGLSEMPLLEKSDSISQDHLNKDFQRTKILAQALAESYMARYYPDKLQSSKALLNHIFSVYPDYQKYADLNLLHTLSFLKDVAFYMDLGSFNDFDHQIVHIGNKLLVQAPYNPYVHSYLGTFYARKENMEKARYHFACIVNAKNFSPNWYTQEAKTWLSQNN